MRREECNETFGLAGAACFAGGPAEMSDVSRVRPAPLEGSIELEAMRSRLDGDLSYKREIGLISRV